MLCHFHLENASECGYMKVGPGRAGREMRGGLACACTGLVAMATAPHCLTKTKLRTSTHLHVCVGRQQKNYKALTVQTHSVTAFLCTVFNLSLLLMELEVNSEGMKTETERSTFIYSFVFVSFI